MMGPAPAVEILNRHERECSSRSRKRNPTQPAASGSLGPGYESMNEEGQRRTERNESLRHRTK